jgi:hypothetical protein
VTVWSYRWNEGGLSVHNTNSVPEGERAGQTFNRRNFFKGAGVVGLTASVAAASRSLAAHESGAPAIEHSMRTSPLPAQRYSTIRHRTSRRQLAAARR